jgi:hypothetical protein
MFQNLHLCPSSGIKGNIPIQLSLLDSGYNHCDWLLKRMIWIYIKQMDNAKHNNFITKLI